MGRRQRALEGVVSASAPTFGSPRAVSARFVLHETPLAGAQVIERRPIADARGCFERLYCAEELAVLFGSRPVAQINRSRTSRRGVVRGLHYQRPPYADAKLVTCVRGAVLDVAVDLRRGSPTFLHWHARLLREEVPESYFLPEGFAHGFQALTDDCELVYLHSAPYRADAEGSLSVRDARIGIAWPLPVLELSTRDAESPSSDGFDGLEFS